MTVSEPHERTEAEKLALRSKARQIAMNLLLRDSLYSKISDVDEESGLAIQMLTSGTLGTFDCYCIECKRETPFFLGSIVLGAAGGADKRLRSGTPPELTGVKITCQRLPHFYEYVFKKVGNDLIKIGQLPSLGTIAQAELKDLGKSLDLIDRKELGTALGLFSHDAASGAFVYLRRVFERMIARAHDRYAEKQGKIEGFSALKMDKKIEAIAGELPERVVRHSKIFSVLSVGIHELSDGECREMFPVVKAVIFQMLEQEEHKRLRNEAEKATDRAFSALLATKVAAPAKEEQSGTSM